MKNKIKSSAAGTGTQMVNAWIFLNEDEPSGTTYNDQNSCYQTLIQNNIYQSVDMLYLCFVTTLPTSTTTVPQGNGSFYTIQMGSSSHPDGLTNQDYMNYIIRDARKNNPKIKIAVTLVWGNGSVISNIFSNQNNTPQQNADNFAANLMAYLQYYQLDGFDIDWESPLCDGTTQEQFILLVNAIGAQFQKQTDKHYYLTISPAEINTSDASCMDPTTINNNVDFMNLQLYFSTSIPQELTDAGVNPSLFAYGALFEANQPVTDPNAPGDQTAQEAYQDNKTNYQFGIFTNWRLNSQNYLFEQSQQQDLHQLVFPVAVPS